MLLEAAERYEPSCHQTRAKEFGVGHNPSPVLAELGGRRKGKEGPKTPLAGAFRKKKISILSIYIYI